MKYFVSCIKVLILTLAVLVFFPILNTKYQILDTNIASAQSIDIGIYPPIFQAQVNPPADIKVPFHIQNYKDEPIELTISLKPFSASKDENGQIEFLDKPDYPDPFFLERIKVLDGENEIDSITLSGKQKKDLILELLVPSNEAKGEYYFSVVFTSRLLGVTGSNLSEATESVVSNVLLTIGPLEKTEGLIQNFSSPIFVSKGPVPFEVRVKNSSDHYVTIKGDIIVKNMFNQTIGKVNLLPVNILSNTIRRVPDSLQSNTVSDNKYKQIQSVVEKNKFPVAVWPEKFLLGPYTANLTLSMSDSGPVYKRTIYFFAFPLEYLLGIFAIIGMVIFIILRVRKKMT